MPERAAEQQSAFEVLKVFLKLGLTSFGGPVAHLGYFRTEFVEKRKWLSEADYASLVGLCQFLPGPASSQVGFALGLMRAGPLGAAAAWLTFTLPSALLLFLFAISTDFLSSPYADGIITGLKIVAVAIVAHAVWGMSQNLCPDKPRSAIAFGAFCLVFLIEGSFGQIGAILSGAVLGSVFCKSDQDLAPAPLNFHISKTVGQIALVLFFVFLTGLPLISWLVPNESLAFLDAFYRSGALVFGGGHVVLPLLEAEVVQSGWVSPDDFLAGYGAAQAVPGPLFTFSAYLGGVADHPLGGVFGAVLALVMVFLPGFFLLIGVLPFWSRFQSHQNAQSLMKGTNAAVVGLLGAALYDPVFTSAIVGPFELMLFLLGFLLLQVWKLSALYVVLLLGLGGIFLP